MTTEYEPLVGTQRQRKSQMDALLRLSQGAVRRRSGGHCERCHRWLGEMGEVHHRKPRKAGGTTSPAINTPPNLVHLCGHCHRWAEKWRTQAYEDGWLIHRVEEADETPVKDVGGISWLLSEDGTKEAGTV